MVHVWTGAGVQWEQEKPTERKLQPGKTRPIHPEGDILSAVRLQLVYICVRRPLWRWGVELCRSLRALLHPFWAAEVSLNSAVTSSFRRGLCCTVLGLPTCSQLDLQSLCALSPPAGMSAANNEMFPTTTKGGRRRRKLYKTGDSSPFLDSPLTVRKMINYIINKVLALFFSNNIFGGCFSVICRGSGGERKWSFYY